MTVHPALNPVLLRRALLEEICMFNSGNPGRWMASYVGDQKLYTNIAKSTIFPLLSHAETMTGNGGEARIELAFVHMPTTSQY